MNRTKRLQRGFLLGLGLLLSACGNSGGGAAAPQAAATPPPPASPAVQKIYDTTCHSCHGAPASGAPQAGDAKAWGPRIAQGRDTVLNHVINGYKGMPPMGLCMQCSEDDFVAVTEWMSGGKLK
jgi:cytochrome c5